MTQVAFTLDGLTHMKPGVALLSVWPAFTTHAFKRSRFSLPYGGGHLRSRSVELAAGSYWVKAKFPNGEQVQELVEIPVDLLEYQVAVGANTELSLEPDLSAVTQVLNFDNEFSFGFRDALFDSEKPTLFERTLPSSPATSPGGVDSVRLRPAKSRSGAVKRIRTRDNSSLDQGRSRRGSGLVARSPGPEDLAFSSDKTVDVRQYGVYIIRNEYANWPTITAGSIRGYFSPIVLLSPSSEVTVEISNNVLSAVFPGGALGTNFIRRFVMLQSRPNGACTLISVPAGGGAGRITLTVMPSEETGMRPAVSIDVVNPKYSSLLRFLRQNDLRSAVQILESAEELLYAKFDDPVAAAAAGYVLLNARSQSMRVPWHHWIGNLGTFFDHLPDGRILHAALLLQRSDAYDQSHWELDENYFPIDQSARLHKAAALITAAMEKGPPMYRMGLSLLASNISILLAADLPKDILLSLRHADDLVTALRRRVDTVEPFCVFHLESSDV